ncbi:MAG: hypoxanthine phosphoribosyltransferase [Opitutaceae bacterium]|nr:hypoxanthine phosphoribosyltransferase [Opitutaceae bacterium]
MPTATRPKKLPHPDLERILVTEAAIRQRLKVLGAEISKAYGSEELTVIAVVNGAVFFTADLLRQIRTPVRLDCIRVSSYRNSTRPVGPPRILDTLQLDLEQRHVLLIDDILDTGRTLSAVVAEIQKRKPASVRTCVLLDKKVRREVPLEADFVGFPIPDQFVVGYGLDFAERYRNLPCIGVLKPGLQNPPEWA